MQQNKIIKGTAIKYYSNTAAFRIFLLFDNIWSGMLAWETRESDEVFAVNFISSPHPAYFRISYSILLVRASQV